MSVIWRERPTRAAELLPDRSRARGPQYGLRSVRETPPPARREQNLDNAQAPIPQALVRTKAVAPPFLYAMNGKRDSRITHNNLFIRPGACAAEINLLRKR